MMLGAELTAHLGYEDGKDAPAGQANRRKTIDLVALGGAVPGRGLETFALHHIERHGGALPTPEKPTM